MSATAPRPFPCLARRVGVILLDTRFMRPPGDLGAPETFAGQGLFEIVPGASVARAASGGDDAMLRDFLVARDRLVARGAEIVTTSCGFLVIYQDAMQNGCPVPVVTSSLLQVPRRATALSPGQRLAVIAMDRRMLSPAMMEAAGTPASVVVGGLEQGTELLRVLSTNDPDLSLDVDAAEADVIAAGRALVAADPAIGAVVFECANLPPYRNALARDLQRPVYDILTLLEETLESGRPMSARSTIAAIG